MDSRARRPAHPAGRDPSHGRGAPPSAGRREDTGLHDEHQTDYQERLLRQQLRAGEALDEVFLMALHGMAAVTSERLLVIRPTKANGWEMKSLPWRLVT